VVIIMMGAAGAGKTTIGRALAAELGWTFVDGDELHPDRNIEKMRAGAALTEADRAPWIAAVHATVARAVDRRQHTVLACSALKERYRQTIRGDLRPIRFVYLRASEALLRARLEQRQGHFFDPRLLATQLHDLEEPADALTLDALQAPEAILAEIRREFGV
jgi:gluconokinase